jgi:hypothetical protein
VDFVKRSCLTSHTLRRDETNRILRVRGRNATRGASLRKSYAKLIVSAQLFTNYNGRAIIYVYRTYCHYCYYYNIDGDEDASDMSLGLCCGVPTSSQLTDDRTEEGQGWKSIDSVWRTVDDLRPSTAITTTTTVQSKPEGNGRRRYTDVTTTTPNVAKVACGDTRKTSTGGGERSTARRGSLTLIIWAPENPSSARN